MIMRRLAQNLRDQNWTTILVEFVLLVLGVFLGIQAANWNETRRERALESEYIARLQRDFRAIDTRLAGNLSIWERNASAPIRLLADLEAYQQGGTWPRKRADMLADFASTMGSRIPAPRAASHVELLSAGKLGLMRDTRLRDALLDYDTQTGFTMKGYETLVQRVDSQRPTLVAHLQFDGSIDGSKVDLNEVMRKVGADWRDVDLATLAADNNVIVALSMFASAARNQLLIARLQQEKARAVIALLEPGAQRAEGKQP